MVNIYIHGGYIYRSCIRPRSSSASRSASFEIVSRDSLQGKYGNAVTVLSCLGEGSQPQHGHLRQIGPDGRCPRIKPTTWPEQRTMLFTAGERDNMHRLAQDETFVPLKNKSNRRARCRHSLSSPRSGNVCTVRIACKVQSKADGHRVPGFYFLTKGSANAGSCSLASSVLSLSRHHFDLMGTPVHKVPAPPGEQG